MVGYQTQQCYQPLSHAVMNGGVGIAEIPSQFYLLFGAVSCPGNGVLNKLQFAVGMGDVEQAQGSCSEPHRGALKHPL